MNRRSLFFIKKYETFIMILMGILCIAFQQNIYHHFPIIFGVFMLERSIHGCYEGWKNRDFFNKEQVGLERSILGIIIAVGIMIRRDEALIVASIFWALSGIEKSSRYLNEIFYQISNREWPKIRICVAFFMELILSLILLFEPLDNVEHLNFPDQTVSHKFYLSFGIGN